uniref:Transcription factor bHLH48 isoform X1 n=1 Tax=Rhizophora mucronata TaxID=61149 RepID=A0A2P2MRW3_RHIMU
MLGEALLTRDPLSGANIESRLKSIIGLTAASLIDNNSTWRCRYCTWLMISSNTNAVLEILLQPGTSS